MVKIVQSFLLSLGSHKMISHLGFTGTDEI